VDAPYILQIVVRSRRAEQARCAERDRLRRAWHRRHRRDRRELHSDSRRSV